jgi:2-oxoglutarate ferredoxin oxidoreductase subunit alpha
MDAGSGAQKAGDILLRAFADTGRYVFIEPVIPAEISPPQRSAPALSGSIIRVADFDLNTIGDDSELIMAAHEVVLDTRLNHEEASSNVRVLLDMGDQRRNQDAYAAVIDRVEADGGSVVPIAISAESDAIIRSLGGAGRNMVYVGLLAWVYDLPAVSVETAIRSTFSRLREEKLEKNVTLFQQGYALAESVIPFRIALASSEPEPGEKVLMNGNTALSLGMIDAGIKFMSGYPITPASSVMHLLAKELPSYGGTVHQAEDEIAAIGATIGAYFGGTPSVTVTSGPGLSLKQEFIGYAGMAEIPLIVVDVQRAGPSTGMPTRTEQSDLPATVFGRHGDNVGIVFSVSDTIDCFYAPHLARYLAESLRLPVIVMSDFQTANSYKIVARMATLEMTDVNEIPDSVLAHFGLTRLPAEIPMVKNNLATPGEPGKMRRVTGLNTDAEGRISYTAASAHGAHAIRNAKVRLVAEHSCTPVFMGDPDADLLVVGWGSSRGALEEAVGKATAAGLAVAGLHLRVVHPLPADLAEKVASFSEIITVESAYGDAHKPPPLAMLMRIALGRPVRGGLCQATGRPLAPGAVLHTIEEALA